MAQLSDDCFAFDGPLLGLDEALARLADRLVPVAGEESVPLAAAAGRVLPHGINATLSVPPYRNAAVDGYAVYHADLKADHDTVMPVAGRVAAGHPLDGPALRGQAVRIFTGAPMPPGPDTVMMQEDCTRDGGAVSIRPGIKPGANVREAGEDVAAGSLLLPAGRRLTPPDIGLLAGQGYDRVTVRRPLSVAILSSGDEVVDPGTPLADGKLYDSNRFMLGAALAGMGFAVTDLGILPDRRDAIEAALLRAAEENDAIVTSGGMSTGEEDHMKAAIEGHGSLHFWRLAIKPGRPVGLGQIRRNGRAVPVMGLPGNTVAAFTTFALLGRPLLQRLQGVSAPPPRRYPAVLGFDYRKKAGRREFARVRIAGHDADGLPVLERSGRGGAGILSSVAAGDGFAEFAEHVETLENGARTDYLPYTEVLG